MTEPLCHKIAYPSPRVARRAYRKLRGIGVCAYYKCQRCEQYHLTSQRQVDLTQVKQLRAELERVYGEEITLPRKDPGLRANCRQGERPVPRERKHGALVGSDSPAQST